MDLLYEERLEELGMETLETRRRIYDAKYVHALSIGAVDQQLEEFFEITPHNRLYIPLAKSRCLRESFAVRGGQVYNTLPQQTRGAHNMITFGKLLQANEHHY
jgi:hypothetical protein